MDRVKKQNNRSTERKCSGRSSFESILLTVLVALTSIAGYPLTTELAWPRQRSYRNRFLRELGMWRKKVYDQENIR